MRVEKANMDYKTKLAKQWRDIRNEQHVLENAPRRVVRELPTSSLKDSLHIMGRDTRKVRHIIYTEV